MTFVFPILLGGLALVGIPVLLHLIFRQKPRRLQFPAFRFLVKRQRTNLRKLQLRHILLLTLRVLLIAAICLALARPKLFYTELNLSSDRPVAAVFLIDTSPSMEYSTSDKQSRLEEARKRAVELLNELPAGSRIAVLDSAETVSSRGTWLSASQARPRIDNLALQYSNAPLTRGVLGAFRMFRDAAREGDDELRYLPRFICVFSDRTRACWDASQQTALTDAHDQVPPLLEGLQQLRGDIPTLMSDLGELRKKLPPPAGQDYPEQALIAGLENLRDQIGVLRREDLATDPELARVMPTIRRGCREILAILRANEPKKDDPAAEYRTRIIDRLETLAHQVQGAYGIFVDIGVEAPVDLAIGDLQLPRRSNGLERQLFDEDEKILLRVPVTATGKDYDNEVICSIAGNTFKQAVSVKAGERGLALFDLDAEKLRLAPGFHQVEVRLSATDLLPFNNLRYLTFAIREPKRILVLADDAEKADPFVRALRANRFTADLKRTADLKKTEFSTYDAVFLFQLAEPSDGLWQALEKYVNGGGKIGVVPGGVEMKSAAYNGPAGQKLLPGKFEAIVKATSPKDEGADKKPLGAAWDYSDESIYQHPLLRPFGDWRHNQGIDFIATPHRALQYWQVGVDLKQKDLQPLIKYANQHQHAALLERRFDSGGRVLLYTTKLDGDRDWNNYLEQLTSIYVTLTGLSGRYFTGELDEPNLNFQCGRDVPSIALSPGQRYRDYIIRGPAPEFHMTPTEGVLRLEASDKPGNYIVEGAKSASARIEVARFSVNTMPIESDLTRVPELEIEHVLGPKAVTTVQRRANIRTVLRGHFSEPLELFPHLMVFLLIVLALENLLANKFYRKQSAPEDGAT